MLGLLTGCQRSSAPVVQALTGETMGTTYTIKLVPDEQMPSLSDISERVTRELERVNAQMSTYVSSSELSRFNDQRTSEWFEVSPETAEVTQLALDVHQLTGGAFDVTVGPLVDLWGFGPPRRPDELPSEEAIAAALKSVGSDQLEVRSDPPALRKKSPDLRVDLSAIAKGHGVDRVAKVLDALGFENYFVEIGGEVRTRGMRIDGQPWRVGIEQPIEGERAVHSVVGISNRSLATSGDYRNFYEEAGKRVSHFIDPRTGRPVAGETVSASVVADNCALADALATGLMASGFEDGLKLAESNGWAALLIARRGGRLVTASTKSFEALDFDAADFDAADFDAAGSEPSQPSKGVQP